MDKKIIFFDVDGTLVDVRPAREYVPDLTIKAIQETRGKGTTAQQKQEAETHRHRQAERRTDCR